MDFLDLKKLGVVLKRAQYFITCSGKYFGSVPLDDEKIKKVLTPKIDLNIVDDGSEQISFFDNKIKDTNLLGNKKLFLLNDKNTSYTGEI